MLLGFFQASSPAGDIPAGLAAIDAALAGAAGAGVDMLVMPELFLPGYAHASAGHGLQDDHRAAVADLCRRHGTALTVGLAERDGERVYNAAFAFGPDGQELAHYRKIQLFGPQENATFTPGDAYVTFDHGGVRFGLLICYDVEFPEHVRALARRGVQAILVPTANMMPFVNVHQITVPARACENGLTIVYANYCGAEADLAYNGLSAIFGPDGYILGAKGGGPGLCVAELPGGWSEHDIPLSTQLADLRVIEPAP